MRSRLRQTIRDDLLRFAAGRRFSTVLADPPWRFSNRTGKMAPEHKRLSRYNTMTLNDIMELPVPELTGETAHLYLWVPNALLAEGLQVVRKWGFTYKTNIVWYKIRKDGGPDRRGVGFYFRNVTELVLFGIKGKNARTLKPGRTQPNLLATRKREHSRKPDEHYEIIEACSKGPYLELFARHPRTGWYQWGDELDQEDTAPKSQFHQVQIPIQHDRGDTIDHRLSGSARTGTNDKAGSKWPSTKIMKTSFNGTR